jgi:hypothetical protein
MLKRIFAVGFLSISHMLVSGIGSAALAQNMNLVSMLTKHLNVSSQQAEGGAGAIFNAASQNMSLDDFAQVTSALPDVQSLMKAAPSLGTGSGTLGGLSSMLGKSGGGVASLAGLTSAFSQLGMDADMVQKFIPVILDYAQNSGGDRVADLLKMALQ